MFLPGLLVHPAYHFSNQSIEIISAAKCDAPSPASFCCPGPILLLLNPDSQHLLRTWRASHDLPFGSCRRSFGRRFCIRRPMVCRTSEKDAGCGCRLFCVLPLYLGGCVSVTRCVGRRIVRGKGPGVRGGNLLVGDHWPSYGLSGSSPGSQIVRKTESPSTPV